MAEIDATRNDIEALAKLILSDGLSDEFRATAREAAGTLGADDIDNLMALLHRPPEEPSDYDFSRHGFGGWLSAWQFAIFELIYCIGAPAIPAVRKIAWGPYDWIQGNAVEILIRFAADGHQPTELIDEIKRKFPDIRHEAQLYAIEPLLPRLESDDGLKGTVDQLMPCQAFQEVYREVTGA